MDTFTRNSVTAFSLISIFLTFLVLPVFGQKTLILGDEIYEPQIKTVICYPSGPGLPPGVAKLSAQNLIIEFDDLQSEHANYYVRLVHCNFDWTKSTLMDLDILRAYNEITINDYTYSINTQIPYVHYRFTVPTVKIPGNYVVVVYRDSDLDDLMLSRRVLIFDSKTSLIPETNLQGLGTLAPTHQALNFTINYGQMEILNPYNSVHLAIRQNLRWDNAKGDVKPSALKEFSREIEYRFFDIDHAFEAGNEFRFLDFRSLNSPGQNTTGRVDRRSKPFVLQAAMDLPRGTQSYTQFKDMNGSFIIENLDYQSEPWITTNYLFIEFALKSPQLSGDVFVLGSYNQWAKNDDNKMTFREGIYSKQILLKQGFYNYTYVVVPDKQKETRAIEGSYFQTENLYDVLVYYRPFQPDADLLIGYFLVPSASR